MAIVKLSQGSQDHRLDGIFPQPIRSSSELHEPSGGDTFSGATVGLLPTGSFANDSGAEVACRIGSVASTSGIAAALL